MLLHAHLLFELTRHTLWSGGLRVVFTRAIWMTRTFSGTFCCCFGGERLEILLAALRIAIKYGVSFEAIPNIWRFLVRRILFLRYHCVGYLRYHTPIIHSLSSSLLVIFSDLAFSPTLCIRISAITNLVTSHLCDCTPTKKIHGSLRRRFAFESAPTFKL